MSERTRIFNGKKFFSYCVVHESGADGVVTHLKNRHYLIRTTKDQIPKYREIWTYPKVKS